MGGGGVRLRSLLTNVGVAVGSLVAGVGVAAPKRPVPATAQAQALELLRAEYAELLAHARAAVAAARLDHAAPLVLLEGHLEKRGQLPVAGARPEVEVARAYAASVDVYALAGVVSA